MLAMSKSKSENTQDQAHKEVQSDESQSESSLGDATLCQGDEAGSVEEDRDKFPKLPINHWDTDPVQRRRRLEAVLFLARSPISSRKLSQLAGLEDGTQARTMVRQLNENYDKAGRDFSRQTNSRRISNADPPAIL